MITLESIKNTFSKMKKDGINTDKDLLWGYFFTSEKTEQLDKLKKKLINEGLIFVDISKHDDNKFWLHLEEIYIHTFWTLNNRCEYYYELADEFNVIFDGYDVGRL